MTRNYVGLSKEGNCGGSENLFLLWKWGEIHCQGIPQEMERELYLSSIWAIWIVKGLLDRRNHFGTSKRKESISLDKYVVSLIEGSNSEGVFLSIQLKRGQDAI